jgi:hypothetical protein
MFQVSLTLVWGLVLLASCVAMGRLLARAFDRALLGDAPLMAGLGMAGFVVVGGVLNLAYLATSGMLIGLMVVPIVVEGMVTLRGRRPAAEPSPAGEASGVGGRWDLAAFASIGLLFMTLTIRYVLSLGHQIHKSDDLPFYLPEIVKLLQTGSLGVEPYLFRQMSTLNGQSLLSALGCCVVPLEYAHLVDPAVCWIILGGLVYNFLRRDLGLPIPLSGLLAAVSLLFRIAESNLGGQMSGPTLMVTAARLLFTAMPVSADPPRGRPILAGLVLASLASLKSTMLIYAVVFVAFWPLLSPRWKASTIVGRGLLLGLSTFLFLSPWLIQQYLSSGTPLYPILGKGHLFANHGFPFEIREEGLLSRIKYVIMYAASGYVFAPLVAMLAMAVCFASSPSALSGTLLATSLSGVLGSYLIAFMITQSGGTYRYTSTMLYVSCMLPGLLGISMAARGGRVGLVLAAALFMAMGVNWPEDKRSSFVRLRARVLGQKWYPTSYFDALPDPDYEAKIRRVQSMTEPGERILAGVTDATSLDFRRNPIWNFDMIGLMSPPPGLPLTHDWKGLESAVERMGHGIPPAGPVAEFRDFLASSGVDYVLFERDPHAVYYLDVDIVHSPTGITRFERMCHIVIRLTHENLLNLARDRHPVFDDGNMILLDMRQARRSVDIPFR